MAYIGKSIESGTFSVLDTSDNTYNGSNVTFNLGTQVGSVAQLLVSHDGVIQKPGTDYTLATGGTQITFTTAPASGASIFIVEISGAVGGPLDSDLNGTELILDADGDTSITADTDDQIDIKIAGDDDFTFTASTLTVNSTNKICFNDATQFIQGASGTVLDIAATDEIELTSTLVDLNGNLDVSGTTLLPTLGVVTAKDLGVGIHIRTADSGASVSSTADELVVEGSGDSGITILSGNSSNGRINFGDDGDNDVGSIDYDHNNNMMGFFAGATQVADFFATGIVFNEGSADMDFRFETNGATHALFIDGGANKIGINESAHNATRGLAINQAADDEAILLFYSSDVAHGITDIAETDTFGGIHKKSGTAGGIIIKGTSEGTIASTLQGIVTTANTTKGTGGDAPIQLDANLKSGTGVTAVGSNGNLLIVTNAGNAKFIVDAEGDIHYDGSDAGAYDTYDDAQLVRAFDLSHGKGVIDSKFDKFVSYNHEKLAEMKLVGREDDGTPNHFINTTGMQRLHNGAIWQQYEKHNQLLEAVYELAEKAVGKKEADAILDKHEVKRLN